MTQYALLIYGTEAGAIREATPADIEPWTKLGEAMEQAGVLRGGTQLHRTSTTQSVRERGGEVLTTTGPFAETTEQLGGVYLLDCASMEEALEWAAQVPAVTYGTIEVRPIVASDID